MKHTRLLMGVPITVEVVDPFVTQEDLDKVFSHFVWVDTIFSTYKTTSDISKINRGELSPAQYSDTMRAVLTLSEQTKEETNGYFDVQRDGVYDPSGIVKGWAIRNAAHQLEVRGFRNFAVDAGGDIQVAGLEGYMIDAQERATFTSGFERYVCHQ